MPCRALPAQRDLPAQRGGSATRRQNSKAATAARPTPTAAAAPPPSIRPSAQPVPAPLGGSPGRLRMRRQPPPRADGVGGGAGAGGRGTKCRRAACRRLGGWLSSRRAGGRFTLGGPVAPSGVYSPVAAMGGVASGEGRREGGRALRGRGKPRESLAFPGSVVCDRAAGRGARARPAALPFVVGPVPLAAGGCSPGRRACPSRPVEAAAAAAAAGRPRPGAWAEAARCAGLPAAHRPRRVALSGAGIAVFLIRTQRALRCWAWTKQRKLIFLVSVG